MHMHSWRHGVTTLLVVLVGGYVVGVPHVKAAAPVPGAPTAAAQTRSTITLDLKGVDILDVLKLLSQKSNINFVAGRNVTGRVTIFARDVGVWDAFERIVLANNLAYEEAGKIVNVMTGRDYELLYGEKFEERKIRLVLTLRYAKADQLATVVNQLKSNIGKVVVDEVSNTLIIIDAPGPVREIQQLVEDLDLPTKTRVFELNYAEAESLKDKIQEFLTPGVGIFSFDARTNKIIISDLEEALPRIEQVILAYDERDGTVLIEAKIIKVELDDDLTLGVDWQQVFSGVDIDARWNLRVLGDIIGAGTAKGGAIKLLSDKLDTQLVIEALRNYGLVETISNPRIMVMDGEEAKILVGKKEVFVTTTTTVPSTGTVVSSPQLEFVDVGTKLFVTPNIKRDGHVQLHIRPEVSSATVETFNDNRIPIVTTTETETTVLVKSGTTIVIGGLIDTKDSELKKQVPILGDLPLIGAAFRSVDHQIDRTELVIFLTPQIVSPTGEPISSFALTVPDEALMSAMLEAAHRHAHPVPASYQALVRDLLQAALRQQMRNLSLDKGSVSMSFVLMPDGTLIAPPKIRSPQGNVLIGAAQAAFKAVTFPPFPEYVKAAEVTFRLAVDYRP